MRDTAALVIVALLALSCGSDSEAAGRLQFVGLTSQSEGSAGRPTQRTVTIELRLPRRASLARIDEATLVDKAGRRYRAASYSVGRSSEEGDRLTATFEVASNAQPATLLAGGYEFDLTKRRYRATAVSR